MNFSLVLDLVIVALLVPTIIFAVVLNNRLAVLRKNREELARLVAAFNEATVRAESGIPRLRKTSEDSARALQEQAERARTLRDDLAFMIERAEGMAARLEGAVRQGRAAEGKMAAGRPATVPPAAMDIESAAAAADRIKAQFPSGDRAGDRAGAAGRQLGRLDLRAESEGGAIMPDLLAERLPDGLLENLPDRLVERVVAPAVTAPPAAPVPPPPPAVAAPPAPVAARPARAGRAAPTAAASLGASLGASLARDGGASGAGGGAADDDGRSEAERELLRALQSVR
ncbi:DUF6468 domain-containing protein [Novispirillum sp. DQ9]|uniref:DUF6468 domain-containing protein n=1 Tax=Novispirillum sp. DQ9 TaxID=3398612 RepID=UPI003C7D4FF7